MGYVYELSRACRLYDVRGEIMTSFLKVQKKQFIVATAMIMTMLVGSPVSSKVQAASDTEKPNVVAPVLTSSGKTSGKIAPGTTVEFKITDDTRLGYVLYGKDLYDKTNQDGSVNIRSKKLKSYSYYITVPEEPGLYEYSIAAQDYNKNTSNWTTVTYYVVADENELKEVDKTAPELRTVPRFNSSVTLGNIPIEYKEEGSGIYFFAYKWVNASDIKSEDELKDKTAYADGMTIKYHNTLKYNEETGYIGAEIPTTDSSR